MREHDQERIGRKVEEAYRRPVTPDPGARDRLLEEIARRPAPARRGWTSRAWWHPLGPARLAAAAAAVLVVGGALAVRALAPADDDAIAPSPAASTSIVRFQLAASGAAQVTLVGDFNGWDRQATPMRPAGEPDVWTVSLALGRGRHVYAFIVDGERWVPDPAAPLAPADGFGGFNSVVVVEGPGAS
jgi:hypothetical protein